MRAARWIAAAALGSGIVAVAAAGTQLAAEILLGMLAPLAAVSLYILHRRAGPDIQWKWGYVWGGAVGAFVVVNGMSDNTGMPWDMDGTRRLVGFGPADDVTRPAG